MGLLEAEAEAEASSSKKQKNIQKYNNYCKRLEKSMTT